jgi:hypothetical protein
MQPLCYWLPGGLIIGHTLLYIRSRPYPVLLSFLLSRYPSLSGLSAFVDKKGRLVMHASIL